MRVLAFAALLALPCGMLCTAVCAQNSNVRAMPPFSATEQVVSRFEAGVQYTNLGLNVTRNSDGSYVSAPGRALGPALTVNLSRNVAIDAMLAQSPQSQEPQLDSSDGAVAGGHSLEFLAGPRLEVRGGRLGIFVAARGGFLNWSHVLQDESYTILTPSSGTFTLRYGAGYYPVIEAAAGVEYAVTPRVHLRGDIGDQFTQYHTQSAEFGNQTFSPTYTWPRNGTAFVRVGAFVGFGAATRRPLAPLERTSPHRFLDKANVALLVVSAMAQTADYVTTELFLHRNTGQESNGLARPFLNQGWPGVVPVAVIVNGVQLGFMYSLHKMGHHWLERLPPLAVAAGAGHGGYVSSKAD